MDHNVIEVKYEVDESKNMTIYSSVPEYLEIRDNSTHRYGVITKKDIKKVRKSIKKRFHLLSAV